jgi:hypothetical protein
MRQLTTDPDRKHLERDRLGLPLCGINVRANIHIDWARLLPIFTIRNLFKGHRAAHLRSRPDQ